MHNKSTCKHPKLLFAVEKIGAQLISTIRDPTSGNKVLSQKLSTKSPELSHCENNIVICVPKSRYPCFHKGIKIETILTLNEKNSNSRVP